MTTWAIDPAHIDYTELPHRDRCYRPPRADNPLYPLPPFFDSLDDAHRNWWLVNAVSIQDTPEDFVVALTTFDSWFLWPDASLFYIDKFETPKFHFQMAHDIAAYKLNCFVAPRYSAKSTFIKKVQMLLALTRRRYRVGGLYSIQDKCREGIGDIRTQFDNNPMIRAAFGEFSGGRGKRTWTAEDLELPQPFGSKIQGQWMKGAGRGWHGDFLAIDDAEKDPETDEIVPEIVRQLEVLVRKKYMPMVRLVREDLDNPAIGAWGTGILLAGTIIKESMLLARICHSEPGDVWDFWNRQHFEEENEHGYLNIKRHGEKATALLRGVMGEDAYDSEFRGRPGFSEGGKFHIHPVHHTYAIEDSNGDFASTPLESGAVVRWGYVEGHDTVYRTASAADLFGHMDRAILVDPADTEHVGKASDFTAIHVVGNDHESCVWSLDLALGRMKTDEVTDWLLKFVLWWWPRKIVMEAVGPYGKIVDLISMSARDKILDALGWLPIMVPITWSRLEKVHKGMRIDRNAWRFYMHRIRFPVDRRNVHPYSQMWAQVNNFTVGLDKLRYDDAVDTLSLLPKAFRGPGGEVAPETRPYYGVDINELIESGQLYLPNGVYIPDVVPQYGMLSPAALAVIEANRGNKEARHPNRYDRPRRRISGAALRS